MQRLKHREKALEKYKKGEPEAKDDEEEHELDAVAAVVVDRLVAAVEHLLVAVVVVVVVVHSSLQFAACYALVYRLATPINYFN